MFIMMAFNLLIVCGCAFWAYSVLSIWLLLAFRVRNKRAGFLVLLAIPLTSLGLFWHYASRPDVVFEGAFGFSPTADVTELRSSVSGWDGRVVYLRFLADESTIRRIAARGMTEIRLERGRAYVSDPPDWWKPIVTDTAVGYTWERSPENGFATESELLIYAPDTRVAFFYDFAVD